MHHTVKVCSILGTVQVSTAAKLNLENCLQMLVAALPGLGLMSAGLLAAADAI